MDFIKKHYEKVVLAAALLALIGSAAFLAFKASALSQEVAETIRSPKPKGRPLEPTDIGPYTNAIACLQAPPVWADAADMFATGDRLISETRPVVEGPVHPKDPVVLLGISRRPFKLMFKSYMGEGQNFAVNFLTRSRTFFVAEVGMEIADQFERTGYFIKKFVRTNEVQNIPGVGPREVDTSFLIIQHEGDEPITLVLNRPTEEKEPVASVQCAEGNQTYAVSRGQKFDCSGKTYIVVDITSTQLIIMDKQSREKSTINPAIGGR
jgi:hypothetical protein